MHKIVITGALGHIGSHVAREFAYEFPGCEIVMIDCFLTQRYISLFNLPRTAKYTFIEGDIRTLSDFNVFKNADCILHLAAITDAANSFSNPELIEKNNYDSTVLIADICASVGVPLICISSTSVYGTQENVVDEDCGPDELQPQSPYAFTKLKEEAYVRKLHMEKGLKAVICRFGTIFGPSPGMRFHTAVNKFCFQASLNRPLSVWKTAYDQKRPYLDLRDASRAITHIIKNDLFNGETYNILTENFSVRAIVEAISEFIPKLEIEFVDSKIMNQLSYEVSRRKFENTNFVFSGKLEQGIGKTIDLLYALNGQRGINEVS